MRPLSPSPSLVTSLDNGGGSPRKLLRAMVARLLGADLYGIHIVVVDISDEPDAEEIRKRLQVARHLSESFHRGDGQLPDRR
jgi:hypothetical protein